MNLQDKVILITGASSGIGEATAKKLAKYKVKLVLAARRLENLEKIKEELAKETNQVLIVKTDVTRQHDVENLVKKTVETFGRIDVLINNAGIMPLSFMRNLKVEEWDRMIDVNIKGALYNIAAVLPLMREQKFGHIINVSSVAGRKLFPTGAVYCATKFALNAITEGLRSELDPQEGIRLTAIEPGAVTTELLNSITDEEVMPVFAEALNIKFLDPSDIARAIHYALTQPEHVNVAELLVLPSQQRT